MVINKREKEIFQSYLDVVVPSMIEYENQANAFPTGIMNEIRDIFFHFSKMAALDEAKQEDELVKAERHMKRAMRDCYKYLCVAFENRYQNYREDYKAFLRKMKSDNLRAQAMKIEEQHMIAMDALTNARVKEKAIDASKKDEEIYVAYKKAIQEYRNLMEEIKGLYSLNV